MTDTDAGENVDVNINTYINIDTNTYINIDALGVNSHVIQCRVAKTHRMPYVHRSFSAKEPIISGSLAKNDLQLKASYGFLPLCSRRKNHFPRLSFPFCPTSFSIMKGTTCSIAHFINSQKQSRDTFRKRAL